MQKIYFYYAKSSTQPFTGALQKDSAVLSFRNRVLTLGNLCSDAMSREVSVK